MQLVLLPGLLLTLVGGVYGGATSHPADISQKLGLTRNIQSVYSIAAQTTTTATTTIAVTSTQAVTGTEALTNAGTTTSTVPQSTPPPLPSASSTGGNNLRINPFDWNFLTSVANPPLGPFAWVYLAGMLSLFWVCFYIYFFKRNEWKRTNSVLKRAAERWGQIGMWIAGLGLFSLVLRVIQLDFFNLRFWFYLWALAAVVAGGWFFYWYRTDYPKAMEKFLKTQRARQYMPGTAKKGVVQQAVAPQRGGNPGPAQAGDKRRRKR